MRILALSLSLPLARVFALAPVYLFAALRVLLLVQVSVGTVDLAWWNIGLRNIQRRLPAGKYS